jgi:hypothetical protein
MNDFRHTHGAMKRAEKDPEGVVRGGIGGVKARWYVAGVLAISGVALWASPGRAQMQRSVFETLPVPGQSSFPNGRWQNVWYYRVGFDYLYRSFENYARVPEQSDNPDNVAYVILAPTAPNSAAVITPFWDFPIGAGSYQVRNGQMVWTDNCSHAHFGYSAFRGVAVYNGVSWSSTYYLIASEGRIGRRYGWVNGKYQPVRSESNPQAPCHVTSDPDTTGALGQYIWKNSVTTLNPATFPKVQNGASIFDVQTVTVAMQGATHGFGGCGYFQCFPKVSVGAYRTK